MLSGNTSFTGSDVVQSLTPDAVTSSPYETASVAMALDEEFLIDWLLARQHRDGSWGGRIPFLADRLLQTMMVTRALMALRHWQPIRAELQDAIEIGIRFTADALNRWEHSALEECDLAGFELVVPAHYNGLCREGAKLPELPSSLSKRWQRKLALLPPALFSNVPPTHILHAVEAIEALPDGERLTFNLARAVDPSQLAGASPSATAYLLRAGKLEEERAAQFKSTLRKARGKDHGYCSTLPIDSFISLWKMYYDVCVSYGDKSEYAKAFDALIACHEPTAGIGCNPSFITDADDTAVALFLASKLGRDQIARVLARSLLVYFYDKHSGFFQTYPFEMTTSITTNAHAIEALRTAAPILAQDPDLAANCASAWRRAARYLLESRLQQDKWHVSPYYLLQSCVQALQEGSDIEDILLIHRLWHKKKLQQLLDEQHTNGGWGAWGITTCEETCYALLALLTLVRHNPSQVRIVSAVAKAVSILQAQYIGQSIEMWIDKTLYQPTAILNSLLKTTRAVALSYLHAQGKRI